MSMIAFYNGASGMHAFQSKMNVIGHNMANVQTYGYKPGRAAFDELIRTRINTNVESEVDPLVGHGVKQEFVDQIMNQAGLDMTMRELDFALTGSGFFQVEYGGVIEYTRNGAFALSMEGDVPTLVTNDGAYVLDEQGQRITIEQDPQGNYITDDLVEKLAVYRFPNQWGLVPTNNSRYVVSENSGEAELVDMAALPESDTLQIYQGAVEFSGVDMGNEMVEIIMAQRGFQMNSRVLQTADEIANELNNLR